MINQGISILMSIIMSISVSGCSGYSEMVEKEKNAPQAEAVYSETETQEEDTTMENIQITINDKTFTVTMADTKAADEFISMLPMTLNMQELNGNEKYSYISSSLTTDTYRPNEIQTGDLMLYGSDCIVLFYESFSSSYSYTALGSIDDIEGLKEAVGTGSVEISFKAQ